MAGKIIYLAIICPALLLMWTGTSKAVTINMSSPQADPNIVLKPGDTVELTITAANETRQRDIVVISLSMTMTYTDQNGQQRTINLVRAERMRLILASGQTVIRAIETTLPEWLEAPVPPQIVKVTIEASAKGLKTDTQSSDSLDFLVAMFWGT